jgi:hypothetical protein
MTVYLGAGALTLQSNCNRSQKPLQKRGESCACFQQLTKNQIAYQKSGAVYVLLDYLPALA